MPHSLSPVVAVPARNEEQRLPDLLFALDRQIPWSDRRELLPVVLVLNNTTDGSAALAREMMPQLTNLDLMLVEVNFDQSCAHVGSARRMAMENAYALVGDTGAIMTTDADAVPSHDWVLQNLVALSRGADIVGGRIIGDPREEAALGQGFIDRAGKYARYSALCDELASLVDPVVHDPWPRHQDHTGGSIALRGDVYRAVGGLPAMPFREDIALVTAVVRAGSRLVHPMEVSVTVSARTVGRAPGGMADCVRNWMEDEAAGRQIMVESPDIVEARLLMRHAIRSRPGRTSSEIARAIEEEAASDLDVIGTVPIETAIDHLAHRLSDLKVVTNAA